MNKNLIYHIIFSVGMSFLVALLSSHALAMRPWQIVLSSLLIIIPILLTWLYASKIYKIHRLQVYSTEGWLFRIFSRSTFSTIIWSGAAVFEGSLIFGQLTTHTFSFNFTTLLVYLCCFYVSKILVQKLIGKTYKEFYKPIKVIFWTSIISSLCASLIWAFVDPLQVNEIGKFASVADTYNYLINQQEQASANSLALFHKCVAFKDCFLLYFTSKYGSQFTYFIFNFISQFPFFIGLGAFLGFTFINWSELKRIWCPPSETPLPPQLNAIFWSAFLGVIGILGYSLLVVSNEAMFGQIKPAVEEKLSQAIRVVDKVIVEVDHEGKLLQPGTVELYNNLVIKAASTQIKYFVEEEIRLINCIYDSLENGVDKYLDWYYSLAAEYARLGKLLLGGEELENYMDKNFQELLYSPRTQAYLEELANLEKKISKGESIPSYAEFIKDKIVEPNSWEVMEIIPAPPIVTYPEVLKKMDITDGLFKTRMTTATGAGIAGALGVKVLSKKIAGKVAAKGIFKMGAKVLAKVAVKTSVSIAGGGASGAAVGAVVGSVVPGVGTAVGAAVGGVLGGIATWFAADEVFLKAEEFLDRNSYRQEILSAIRQEREMQISELRNFLYRLDQNINSEHLK